DRSLVGERGSHCLTRRGPHPGWAVLRRRDCACDRPLTGRDADVLAAGVLLGQRAPGGAADLGVLPRPLYPRLALPRAGHSGAVPLLPGGLPVDRCSFAAG